MLRYSFPGIFHSLLRVEEASGISGYFAACLPLIHHLAEIGIRAIRKSSKLIGYLLTGRRTGDGWQLLFR